MRLIQLPVHSLLLPLSRSPFSVPRHSLGHLEPAQETRSLTVSLALLCSASARSPLEPVLHSPESLSSFEHTTSHPQQPCVLNLHLRGPPLPFSPLPSHLLRPSCIRLATPPRTVRLTLLSQFQRDSQKADPADAIELCSYLPSRCWLGSVRILK